MLSYQTIEPHTLELLKALMAEPLFEGLRLVGGTSLALQYGHRSSVDIDLFGSIVAEDEDISNALRNHGKLTIRKESPNIHIYELDDVKVDIVNYSYAWIDDAVMEDGIVLASPKDIAAMKINAVEGRGTKKDFIDVNELLKHYSLEDILHFYSEKYPEYSEYRALLSLSYFDDAEMQPMPKMFIADTWNQVKQNIKMAIKDL